VTGCLGTRDKQLLKARKSGHNVGSTDEYKMSFLPNCPISFSSRDRNALSPTGTFQHETRVAISVPGLLQYRLDITCNVKEYGMIKERTMEERKILNNGSGQCSPFAANIPSLRHLTSKPTTLTPTRIKFAYIYRHSRKMH